MSFAAFAKSIAGYHCHTCFMEQSFAEFLRSQASHGNRREHIKCPSGFKACQSHIIEGFHQILPSFVISLTHCPYIAVAKIIIPQGFNGAILAHGWGTHDDVSMYLIDDFHQFLRTSRVAQTPACHGERLCKAVEHHCPFLHAFHRSNRNMIFAAISQFRVNFIGNHQQVVFDANRGNPFQVFPFHDGTGGVIGIRQNQRLCFGCNSRFQFFGHEFEVVFRFCSHHHRHPMLQLDSWFICHIGRFHHKHFVSRFQNGTQCHVNGFGCADGAKNLVCVIIQIKAAFQIMGNFLPQFGHAPVGGISCFAFRQRIHGSFPHTFRCFEIRFPNAKGNDVVHGSYNIKKFPNSGRRQNRHMFCCKISHFYTFSFVIIISPDTGHRFLAVPARVLCPVPKWSFLFL